MNIANFLTTKNEVAYVFDDFTLRQGLEKMHYHKYAAIPVLSRDNKYIGTISEGTFLWFIMGDYYEELSSLEDDKPSIQKLEDIKIANVVTIDKNPPVPITAKMDEVLLKAVDKNFIPVIDDRQYFIGIVKRRDIIKYFINKVKV